MTNTSEFTQLLDDLTGGNRTVLDALLPAMYDALQGLARKQLRRERANHTLDTGANAQKRGGGEPVATFEDGMSPRAVYPEELIDLDNALKRLENLDERQSQVVVYRFYGGLTHREIAEVLDVSESTVRRDWRLARAWLSRELRHDLP